jgi:hypothetical protein
MYSLVSVVTAVDTTKLKEIGAMNGSHSNVLPKSDLDFQHAEDGQTSGAEQCKTKFMVMIDANLVAPKAT